VQFGKLYILRNKLNDLKKYVFIIAALSIALFFFSFCEPTTVQDGKDVYKKACLPCHQANGEGVPGMNPPLIKTKQVLGDKTKLISIVVNGTNEVVVINGETYDNPMPAQPQLSNKEIADVLTYVRKNFGNKASAITEAEVAAVRNKK
jgi:mono/diheme cytochrome c family protein